MYSNNIHEKDALQYSALSLEIDMATGSNCISKSAFPTCLQVQWAGALRHTEEAGSLASLLNECPPNH